MLGLSITGAAYGFNNEWLSAAGLLLDNQFFFIALIAGIGLFLERSNQQRIRIAAALFITFLSVLALKYALAVDRPCIGNNIPSCPSGYSLPSMHAAIAFTLMFAFLDKKAFPALMALALFVSFTRLNLGVHTFEDVAAALPIAFMSVFLVTAISRWK